MAKTDTAHGGKNCFACPERFAELGARLACCGCTGHGCGKIDVQKEWTVFGIPVVKDPKMAPGEWQMVEGRIFSNTPKNNMTSEEGWWMDDFYDLCEHMNADMMFSKEGRAAIERILAEQRRRTVREIREKISTMEKCDCGWERCNGDCVLIPLTNILSLPCLKED